jgi:hypothetical protein
MFMVWRSPPAAVASCVHSGLHSVQSHAGGLAFQKCLPLVVVAATNGIGLAAASSIDSVLIDLYVLSLLLRYPQTTCIHPLEQHEHRSQDVATNSANSSLLQQ